MGLNWFINRYIYLNTSYAMEKLDSSLPDDSYSANTSGWCWAWSVSFFFLPATAWMLAALLLILPAGAVHQKQRTRPCRLWARRQHVYAGHFRANYKISVFNHADLSANFNSMARGGFPCP